jgi:hypothetical protein
LSAQRSPSSIGGASASTPIPWRAVKTTKPLHCKLASPRFRSMRLRLALLAALIALSAFCAGKATRAALAGPLAGRHFEPQYRDRRVAVRIVAGKGGCGGCHRERYYAKR